MEMQLSDLIEDIHKYHDEVLKKFDSVVVKKPKLSGNDAEEVYENAPYDEDEMDEEYVLSSDEGEMDEEDNEEDEPYDNAPMNPISNI
jgi:hypothetical protein